MTKELFLCFFALTSAILSMMIKSFSKDFSMLLSLASTVFFALFFISYASPVISYISGMLELTGQSECFEILIKGVGISIVVSVVCELCRDLGENGIAQKAETCGKAVLLYMAIPIIKKLFQYIEEFSKM